MLVIVCAVNNRLYFCTVDIKKGIVSVKLKIYFLSYRYYRHSIYSRNYIFICLGGTHKLGVGCKPFLAKTLKLVPFKKHASPSGHKATMHFLKWKCL